MPLKPFLLNLFKHGQANGTRDSVAAKRAEEFHSIIERGSDISSGNHGPNGMSVANGLTENNDVRYDVIAFKSPEVCSYAPVACLHFIGNANATSASYCFI